MLHFSTAVDDKNRWLKKSVLASCPAGVRLFVCLFVLFYFLGLVALLRPLAEPPKPWQRLDRNSMATATRQTHFR